MRDYFAFDEPLAKLCSLEPSDEEQYVMNDETSNTKGDRKPNRKGRLSDGYDNSFFKNDE